jgi:hypothetical protein
MKSTLYNRYLDLFTQDKHDELTEWIDKLSYADRITLRTELEADRILLTKNLYYDYDAQRWID